MVKRLIWSKHALQSKKEIFDYWNKTNGNKNYSRKLNEEFDKIIDLILLFPQLGREVENYDARCVTKGDSIIFYKLKTVKDELFIEILHIWDSRRDPQDLKL